MSRPMSGTHHDSAVDSTCGIRSRVASIEVHMCSSSRIWNDRPCTTVNFVAGRMQNAPSPSPGFQIWTGKTLIAPTNPNVPPPPLLPTYDRSVANVTDREGKSRGRPPVGCNVPGRTRSGNAGGARSYKQDSLLFDRPEHQLPPAALQNHTGLNAFDNALVYSFDSDHLWYNQLIPHSPTVVR